VCFEPSTVYVEGMGKSNQPRVGRKRSLNRVLEAAVHVQERGEAKQCSARQPTSRWIFAARAWKFVERTAVVLSFVGVTYLIYDSLYQTTVALSFPYSDAATGLDNPIAIQNKSNLFTIRNIRWTCGILEDVHEGGGGIANLGVAINTIASIEPGKLVNVSCVGDEKRVRITVQGKLLKARVLMSLVYDADFFGLWRYSRRLEVPFTWVGWIAQPQWIQGEFQR
jgi:hypothetical protein